MMNFCKGEVLPFSAMESEGAIRFEGESSFVTCYSPLRMIELGIFGLGYFGIKDVPSSELRKLQLAVPEFWAQLEPEMQHRIYKSPQDFSLNCYGIKAGLDHAPWVENGWIHEDDPYGWFNWYIRYFYGRRHEDDSRQIKRFRSFVKRHWGMLKSHCEKKDIELADADKSFPKTCQGLLQWGWDYRVDPNLYF